MCKMPSYDGDKTVKCRQALRIGCLISSLIQCDMLLATQGCIDAYPTNSCLNWKPLGVEALTNRTVSQIFEEDLLGFRRHGVYFDSGRGNLSWLNTQITVTNCSSLSASSLLAQICAALPFKARWEVVGLPRKGVLVLRFYRCEDNSDARCKSPRE